MAVALVASGGMLLDDRGWNAEFGSSPDALGDIGALVERWLLEGEGPTIEFKQALTSETARSSFAETIAAFANAQGGTILIGVRDDGTVAGYRPEKVADQITNIARASVTEPVDVAIREVHVNRTYIQVVRVPAGDPGRKPYRCGGRIMIRANATTREASTFEIRSLSGAR
jgi:ATP-dependent DNA helicase RecG